MILSEEKRILIEAYKDGLRSVLMENPNMLAQILIDQIKRVVTKSVLQPKLPKIMEELKKYSVDQLKGAINYFCSPTDAECIRMVEPFTKRQHIKVLGEGGIAAAVGEAYQDFFEPIFRKEFPAGGTSSAKGIDNAIASIKPKVSGIVTKAFGKHLISVQKQKRTEAEQKMRERRYKVNQNYSYRDFKNDWQAIKSRVEDYKNAKGTSEKTAAMKAAINLTIATIKKYFDEREKTLQKDEGQTEEIENIVTNKNGFIMLKPNEVFYPYFLEMYLRSSLDPDDAFHYARGLTARAKGIQKGDSVKTVPIEFQFRQIKDRLANSSAGEPKFYQDLNDPYTVIHGKYPEVYEMLTHDTQRMNWRKIFAQIYRYYENYVDNADAKYDYRGQKQKEVAARANS